MTAPLHRPVVTETLPEPRVGIDTVRDPVRTRHQVLASVRAGLQVLSVPPLSWARSDQLREALLTSTPSSASPPTRNGAVGSSLITDSNRGDAPARLTATAGSAPLPPRTSRHRAAVTAPPGAGRPSVVRTRSRLVGPTTSTTARPLSPATAAGGTGEPQERSGPRLPDPDTQRPRRCARRRSPCSPPLRLFSWIARIQSVASQTGSPGTWRRVCGRCRGG